MDNVEQVKQFMQDFKEGSYLVIEEDCTDGYVVNIMEWNEDDIVFAEELSDPSNMQPLFNYLNLYNIPYEVVAMEG